MQQSSAQLQSDLLTQVLCSYQALLRSYSSRKHRGLTKVGQGRALCFNCWQRTKGNLGHEVARTGALQALRSMRNAESTVRLSTQIQEHTTALCAHFFNFTGALQRDAPPVGLDGDAPPVQPPPTAAQLDTVSKVPQMAEQVALQTPSASRQQPPFHTCCAIADCGRAHCLQLLPALGHTRLSRCQLGTYPCNPAYLT